jgi:hypothetical protein
MSLLAGLGHFPVAEAFRREKDRLIRRFLVPEARSNLSETGDPSDGVAPCAAGTFGRAAPSNISMWRPAKPLFVATLMVMASGCWGWTADRSTSTATSQAVATIRLKPGRYTFHLGGRVRAGDKIVCVTRAGGAAGGGFVPEAGHGVGSSTGFTVLVSLSGKVRITCPANPGNA